MYSIIDEIAENRSEAKFGKNAEHGFHDYTNVITDDSPTVNGR